MSQVLSIQQKSSKGKKQSERGEAGWEKVLGCGLAEELTANWIASCRNAGSQKPSADNQNSAYVFIITGKANVTSSKLCTVRYFMLCCDLGECKKVLQVHVSERCFTVIYW